MWYFYNMNTFNVSIAVDPRKPFSSAVVQITAMIIAARPDDWPRDIIHKLPVNGQLKSLLMALQTRGQLGSPPRRLTSSEISQTAALTPPTPPPPIRLVPPAPEVPVLEASPAPFHNPDGSFMKKKELRKTWLLAALKEAGGNITRAEELTGIGRATIYRWMKEFDIPPTLLSERPRRKPKPTD